MTRLARGRKCAGRAASGSVAERPAAAFSWSKADNASIPNPQAEDRSISRRDNGIGSTRPQGNMRAFFIWFHHSVIQLIIRKKLGRDQDGVAQLDESESARITFVVIAGTPPQMFSQSPARAGFLQHWPVARTRRGRFD